MLVVLVPAGLATVIGLVVLWPGDEPTQAQQVAETYLPPGQTYPDARVVSLQTFPCGDTGGGQATCATAVVEVLEGEGAGDYQQVDLQADVVANGVAEGDTIVLTRDAGADGGLSYQFFDFERTTPLVVLTVAFSVVVGVVARLRGLASLVGLAFAFYVLLQFVMPALLTGASPTDRKSAV